VIKLHAAAVSLIVFALAVAVPVGAHAVAGGASARDGQADSSQAPQPVVWVAGTAPDGSDSEDTVNRAVVVVWLGGGAAMLLAAGLWVSVARRRIRTAEPSARASVFQG